MAKLMCHDWGEGFPIQKVEGNESKGKGGGNESERKGRRKKGEGKDARIRQFLFFKLVIAILALKTLRHYSPNS